MPWPDADVFSTVVRGGLVALTVLVSGCVGPEAELRYTAEYLLADHLETASGSGREKASVPSWEIDQVTLPVLFQRAPARLTFESVPSDRGATFEVAPAVQAAAWAEGTDGVLLRALCRDDSDEWLRLFELELGTESGEGVRGWQAQEVSLSECSQPTSDLRLATLCGAHENCAADRVGWGNPRVSQKRRLTTEPRELVFLISIDTLRADHLALYGGLRPTSPALEELAADGIVFETAIAPAPWTIPSHASLMTSSAPEIHGANGRTAIAAELPLLAEVLQRAGWQTAGFVDTPYLGSDFGFDRGFDHFDDEAPPPGNYRRGAAVVRQRLLNWLLSSRAEPTFVFWHIMDVHGPYGAGSANGGRFRQSVAAPSGTRDLGDLEQLEYHDYLRLERYESVDDLIASYDEGVADVDALVGETLDVLRKMGLYEEALIVVTSDHGESFLDHDVWVGHGLFLTDDELRVPLIVKLPGNEFAGLRVDPMVGLIDVAPTVLDVLELPPVPSFEGLSLVSPEPGAPSAVPTARFSYSSNIDASSLRTSRLKYIGAAGMTDDRIRSVHLRAAEQAPLPSLGLEQLYDLVRDPAEQGSLVADAPDSLARLQGELQRHRERVARARQRLEEGELPEVRLSDEDRQRLQALGYVD